MRGDPVNVERGVPRVAAAGGAARHGAIASSGTWDWGTQAGRTLPASVTVRGVGDRRATNRERTPGPVAPGTWCTRRSARHGR